MKTITSLILLFSVTIGYSQKSYTVTFESLPQKLADEPRPILIKVYTTWCSVCKIQDKKIENNKELQQLLADNCYFLELDAESKKTIFFNNREYQFLGNGTGGMQSLAAAMANPKDGYPTWVLLDSNYTFIGNYNGLLEAEQLKELLSKQ
ncbi:thioredoxin family protein [Flavobacterium sp. DGU11]|uniref:Thioredoxin family protein n=1 Tax=Flavobacterium arundinis TaxID=3139143 RepID=A0ABU9HUH5_9FLAO